ncbi:MAG: Na(+)/H(+) antiporter subunit B [Hyphomicrobiaceae bacterium]
MKMDLILRITTKLLIPFMLLFALYVQFHGDYGPGGGFQAGVITAAMVILYALIFGLKAAQRVVPVSVVQFMVPLGVLVYTGVGVYTMFKGGEFLNYNLLGHDRVHAQEWGILLVEIGVYITVSGTMTAIFYMFAGRGR